MKRNSYFLILIAVLALASCKKDEPVPVGYVNFKEITINPSFMRCSVQCTIESDFTIDGVVVEYSTDSLFTNVQQVPMTEVSSDLTKKQYEEVIKGLKPEHTYYFRCRVTNFSATSTCHSFTTTQINPDAVVNYRASQRLSEVTGGVGLHVDAFGIPIESHEFTNGEGMIVFISAITSIGNSAFYGCTGLTSVTIPNSVTSIEDEAFGDCSSLISVTIPNSVTSIEAGAFAGCSSLASITIPSSVTFIAVEAFSCCSSLTSVTIPNSVTSIGNYTFYGCSSLTSVTIPNSVTSIGQSTFKLCTGLTSVTIPNSVTSIGISAFLFCGSLISITIPNSVTSIGNMAFSDCTGLTSIVCKATTPPTCGEYVFDEVPKSIPVYVPSSSVSKYKSANAWKEFTNIKAY